MYLIRIHKDIIFDILKIAHDNSVRFICQNIQVDPKGIMKSYL